MPALLLLYNTCWLTQAAPQDWKVGALHLLGKSKAAQDPSQPSNFCPNALTYLNTRRPFLMAYQSAQNTMLSSSLLSTRLGGSTNPCVAWLDQANACGSVDHDLIRFSLTHYHAPPMMVDMVSSLYTILLAIFSTCSWTTPAAPLPG